jgi:hypothetical protein
VEGHRKVNHDVSLSFITSSHAGPLCAQSLAPTSPPYLCRVLTTCMAAMVARQPSSLSLTGWHHPAGMGDWGWWWPLTLLSTHLAALHDLQVRRTGPDTCIQEFAAVGVLHLHCLPSSAAEAVTFFNTVIELPPADVC